MPKKFIFSVDLGGTNLKSALFDERLKLLVKTVYSTSRYRSKARLINIIIETINSFISKSGLSKGSLLGVGLGVPGPVDYEKGVVHFFPNIPGWKDVPLAKLLSRKTGLPVIIDNDVNLMCLAEGRFGAAASARNALCITLGTGVGGGILIGGRLYRGSSYLAGEIGHMPLNLDGPRCNCGGRACLERYVGNRYIALYARKAFGRQVSLEELSVLGRKGDKKAIRVWRGIGEYLGVALSSAVNLLNPDTIVIGGGVAEAGEVLFKQVRRIIAERAMPDSAKAVRVVRAELGSDAGLKGAALLVKDELAKV
ncbi:MAG: ROK family protein [Candidatus Omnitrophica bacterium]|nr:ROK family protein [Candidatus Omnitrophota bacterium]